MDIQVQPKPADTLRDTALIPQTSYWGRIKGSLGWQPTAFDITVDDRVAGDVLVLQKPLGSKRSIAYIPYGPEVLPDGERRGEYLAALASALQSQLAEGCIMARWDLPWESPYAVDGDCYDDEGNWLGPPEDRLRELRMNWGIHGTALRKAPSDLLPPDTIILDLAGDEDVILAGMRPKNRYNIRLAFRRGVVVRYGSAEDLSIWNDLYARTALRNRITAHGPDYFRPLLMGPAGQSSVQPASNRERAHLFIAELHGVPMAAMFMTISADRATYLYGASSGEQRDVMAPYALQWAAIRAARAAGCTSYDLFGVAPRPDPEHPMFGLYQFKRGFGGRLLHRQGVWDYPYDAAAYDRYRISESLAPGFNV